MKKLKKKMIQAYEHRKETELMTDRGLKLVTEKYNSEEVFNKLKFTVQQLRKW